MKVNMLSLPGGGIRGVVQARVLDYVEKAAGKPVSSMFHLVAGCSTGGIIAAMLNHSDVNGIPTYKASDIVELYVSHGPAIFDRPWWAPAAIFQCKYDGVELEKVLRKYLGNKVMSECLTEVAITAYDISKNEPYIFKRWAARHDDQKNSPLWVAAKATSAAPTYFPPVGTLVDGGVFSTDPGMVCLDEAYTIWPEADRRKDFYMLSVGNGYRGNPIDASTAKGWGQIAWAGPVIDCLIDGNARNVAHNLKTFMGRDNFDFFQAPIVGDSPNPAMDAASPENINALIAFADKVWVDNRATFDKVLEMVMR